MSWAEVMKINDNMSMPLNEFFCQFLAGGYRQYFYETQMYTIPFSGTYTIRAYCGTYGSYGKIVGKFTQGEVLTITITGTTSITVTSDLQGTSVFHINLGKNANVNGNSPSYIKALAIGGAQINTAGGHAYVRCNNGIAVGGGGSGGDGARNNATTNGYAGGNAYSWGINTFSLGGGGGGAGFNSTYDVAGVGGVGGSAYINDAALTGYCSPTTLQSGKGYNGVNATYNANNGCRCFAGPGGNGGCGGGMGNHRGNTSSMGGSYIPYKYGSANSMPIGGKGYFSDGGYINGASAKAGDIGTMISTENASNLVAKVNHSYCSPRGYFVGGKPLSTSSFRGGTGGFLGAAGYSCTSDNGSGSAGGYSPYGFGGTGGSGFSYYGNYAAYGGKGGDGKIFGGNGGSVNIRYTSNVRYTSVGGAGGNGYYPGFGGQPTTTDNGAGAAGANGRALTANIFLTGTTPLRGMTPTTSIVIIEYGNSIEDF